jgi:ABC-type transport system substrate-binding protein
VLGLAVSTVMAPGCRSEGKTPTVLRYLAAEEPSAFDPYATNRSAQLALMHLTYSGLTRAGASGTPLPDLVREVPASGNGGISRDGRVVKYVLRDDAEFSDGAPVTAQDAVATWRFLRSRMPGGPAPARWIGVVENVRAESRDVVEVTLSRSAAWAVGEILPFVLPARRLTGDALNLELFRQPVGSGPYVLQEWKSGESMRFARNERYHGKRPSIPTIQVEFMQEASKTAAFLAADGPIVWEWVGHIEAQGVAAQRPDALRKGWADFWWGWVFNTASPGMDDPRVRRALALMYPRKRIEQLYLQPFPRGVVPRPLSPDSWAYSAKTALPGEGIAQARRLLAQAGWVKDPKTRKYTRDGEQLNVALGLTTRHPYPFNEWLEEPKDAYGDLLVAEGVVRGQEAPARNYYTPYTLGGTLAIGDFSMGYGAFAGGADPLAQWMFDPEDVPSIARPRGANVGRVTDPVLDRLVRDAELPAAAPVRRARLERVLERLESQVYVMVERPGEKYDLVSGVEGVAPRDGAWGDFHNIEDWTFAPSTDGR